MNRPSLEKFAPVVKPGGIILINRSLISIDSGRQDVDELAIEVSDIAINLGSVRSANIVALAPLWPAAASSTWKCCAGACRAEFAKKEKLIPLNMEAVDAGFRAARRPA